MRNIGNSYSFMVLDFYKNKSCIKFDINVVDGKGLNITTLQRDVICVEHDHSRFACISVTVVKYLMHYA